MMDQSQIELIANYDHLPPIPLSYGFSIIVTAVIFFSALNYKVKRLSSNSSDTWKWRNLFISWIHALIVGVWDLTCFYYYPELTTDLIAFNNLYIYSLVAFSTGYFLYDFIDILANGDLRKTWEVIPHHVAVTGMFFYNVVESRCVAYNVVALLSEVNTIFLHSRKLLQMHDWPFDHWLYRLNSALNLLTFLTCRFLGITWIVYGMCTYHERVSPAYFCILAAAMFVMWVTNVLLFSRLFLSDVIKPYFGRSKVDKRKKGRGCVLLDGKVLANQMSDRFDGGVRRRRIKTDDDGTDFGDHVTPADENVMSGEDINCDRGTNDPVHGVNHLGDDNHGSLVNQSLLRVSKATGECLVSDELPTNHDEPNDCPNANSGDQCGGGDDDVKNTNTRKCIVDEVTSSKQPIMNGNVESLKEATRIQTS